MINCIKSHILDAINTVVDLEKYDDNDYIFSEKYGISPTAMVYILLRLSHDLNFSISTDFVDAMERCTFAEFESLLEKYGNCSHENKHVC